MIKKITVLLACMLCLVSCADADEISSSNSVTSEVQIGADGVTEIITPAEDSEEYDLGEYRISASGIKLYYDNTEIPTELMLTLEKYFTSFQNKDFELYKSCLASDYIERYNKYLSETYSTEDEEYTLQNSFKLQCSNIRNYMIQEIVGDYEIPEDSNYSGDFTITRIRAEKTELLEDETEEKLIENFFEYLNGVLDMDYYTYVKEQADSLKYFTFYIIADGEDGNEHRIISEMDIVFAEKDGKYYTFG